MQACKLRLPPPPPESRRLPSSSFPSTISSIIFENSSQSLALMHSDASVLLYTSIPIPSPMSSPSPPCVPTLITSISTAACFLRLISAKFSSRNRVIFVSAAPDIAGSGVLLRGWIHKGERFAPVKLGFKKDCGRFALVVDVRHGFGVRIAGSVNVLVLHSAADARICVFGVKMGEGDLVELMKCAVIDCVLPVYSVRVTNSLMLLGEVGGVRVFPLKPLVKGRVGKKKDFGRTVVNEKTLLNSKSELSKDRLKKLPNGVVVAAITGGNSRHSSDNCIDSTVSKCIGETIPGNEAPTKLQTMKLQHNSGDLGSFFVEFKAAVVQMPDSKTEVMNSLKAVAMHALPLQKFVIVDSVGDLHVLNIQYITLDSDVSKDTVLPPVNTQMRRLGCSMKVKMLAVLPDASLRTQIVWISDASHSLHMTSLVGMETSVDENNSAESREKPMQLLATEAVFTNEKIHDIVPVASNTVLILGQGNLFAYAAA